MRTEQWDMAKELVSTLKPYEVATTFLSYEENTTISVILPVIFSLVEGLKECSEDSATLKQFKSTVQAELTRSGCWTVWTCEVHQFWLQLLILCLNN